MFAELFKPIVRLPLIVSVMRMIFAYLFVTISVVGCATIGKAPEIEKTEYQVERLPLSVGIYYPPELRDYLSAVDSSVEPGRAFYHKKIAYGKPVVESIDYALTSLFDMVIELSDWPQSKPPSKALNLVIVPRITMLEYPAGARLEVTLFKPSGEALDKFEVEGSVPDTFWDQVRHDQGKIFDYVPPEPLYKKKALHNVVSRLIVALAVHPAIESIVKNEPIRAATERSKGLSDRFLAQAKTATGITIISKLTPQGLRHMSPSDIEGCMEKALKKRDPEMEVVPAQRVRVAIFPWLELGIAPDYEEKLLEVLQRSHLLARLNGINVRYVLTVPTFTDEGGLSGPFICGYGYGGAGCFGFMAGDSESTLSSHIWDLKTGTMGAPMLATSKGKSWAAAFVIPVWHDANTMGKACAEMADQIVKRIKH